MRRKRGTILPGFADRMGVLRRNRHPTGSDADICSLVWRLLAGLPLLVTVPMAIAATDGDSTTGLINMDSDLPITIGVDTRALLTESYPDLPLVVAAFVIALWVARRTGLSGWLLVLTLASLVAYHSVAYVVFWVPVDILQMLLMIRQFIGTLACLLLLIYVCVRARMAKCQSAIKPTQTSAHQNQPL
jgi:hypothetical protein